MSQLIYKKFVKNVKIDESKIRSELLKNNKQNEYLLSEIVFNIQKKDELNKKLNLILDDIKQMVLKKLHLSIVFLTHQKMVEKLAG